MVNMNCTTSTPEFVFSGLTASREVQITLFELFLMIYLVTQVGNLRVVALIHADAHLQTPMYSFLQSLSIVDSFYSTGITPKLLADLLVRKATITYVGCVLQYYTFIFLATSECLLLAVMAYDRYVTVCNSLLYAVIMSPKRCVQLLTVTFIWVS